MADIDRLQQRIENLVELGKYMLSSATEWLQAKDRATGANAWFTDAHVDSAVRNIVSEYLQQDKLQSWVAAYLLPEVARNIGIVMAGNIPLVGFHDFLCGYVSGHNLFLKLSSKDDVLLKQLLVRLAEIDPESTSQITVAERLNNCDAYIATGSNNTARYFEQYFGKYPHIIRRNRTSVAVLDGNESDEQLEALAHDVHLFYGLGCRNVTQLCVPVGYDFVRLLQTFRSYNHYADLNKYKNNYDYHLAIYLLNRVPYMSNESLLMVENNMPFSAVSVLHYRYYSDRDTLISELKASEDIQAIVGRGFMPFGSAQKPALSDYADGIDTMQFLCNLQ